MRRWDDRGAASIFVLGVGLVLVSLGLAGATVGAARVARHQAGAAADFGALAGGRHAVEGEATACAVARHYVEANSARMTGCAVTGLEIVVRTEVALVVFPASAEAASRAGPVSASAGDLLEQALPRGRRR
ncbi:Rv3654c family TadE-like protein [Actinoplanes sandaracinus]|uniref:Rv3654c family TadE-like protein n=1 Tax=Actinoplanes sandaracinus TaxID=3045177 RepID=UPI0038992065